MRKSAQGPGGGGRGKRGRADFVVRR